MLSFYFHCKKCNHVQEELVTFVESKKAVVCVMCDGPAYKALSTPKIHLDGSNPDFVSSHDSWVKEHETKGNGIRSY
jgi:predicted nucleic acid-binding Zn ribbon protein|tara:strand:- start:1217 stop:1447 length:231 start_codon:yes stop_codon:yes gene_type:complete